MVIVQNPDISELTSGISIPNNDFFVIHNDINEEMSLEECTSVFEEYSYPDVDMIVISKDSSFSLSDFINKNKTKIESELEDYEDAGCLICHYELSNHHLIYFSSDIDLNYPVASVFKEFLSNNNIEVVEYLSISHFNLQEEYFSQEQDPNGYFNIYLDGKESSIQLMKELFNYK